MGNQNSSPPLNGDKPFTLEEFKKETPRKMTLHVLSNNKNACKSFVENLTNEILITDELLEKDIIKKINLFSFMNYKLYGSVEEMMETLVNKSNSCFKKILGKNSEFSEVVIVLPNNDINEQIDAIREIIDDNINYLNIEPYLTPFFIFCSPYNINLNKFIPSKTFHYKIENEENLNLKIKDILNQKENDIIKNIDYKEIFELYTKLNGLFSYYNELGDIFSFINSEGREIPVQIVDDDNIAVFINILMIGRTGAGKSTLINLLLDEKKAIEGGSGLSTTSKDLKVYMKKDIPLRFYDAKGFEDEKTVQNFINILTNYYYKFAESKDNINAIFYCKTFTTDTVVENMEIPIFEKLIELKIPILFIITKCRYNPNEKCNDRTRVSREKDKNKIINRINEIIEEAFKKKNKEEDAKEFIKDYVKFYFVNLVEDISSNIKPFGLDEVISFFTELVTEEKWELLEESCFNRDEKNCREYCKENPFLKFYSDFDEINNRNKEESLRYLKRLKAGAFFSGWIPGFDIGMEYCYRYLFKKKLKQLYGFNYKDAEKSLHKNDVINLNLDENNSGTELTNIHSKDTTQQLNNTIQQEQNIEEQISDKVSNKGRNVSVVGSTIVQTGGIFIGLTGQITTELGTIASRFAISEGIQIAGFVLLPITCFVFGAISCYNIHKDCKKILNIFQTAFTPLKFDTIDNYIRSYRKAINYLIDISNKIKKKNNEEIIEN